MAAADGKVDEAMREALAATTAAVKAVDKSIFAAFDGRRRGLAQLEAAVSAAAVATASNPGVRGYAPTDTVTSVKASLVDASAGARRLSQVGARRLSLGGQSELASKTANQLAESRRLLHLLVESIERWAAPGATRGLYTLHGPKGEAATLSALGKAMSDTSAAKPLVQSVACPDNLTAKQRACAKACETFCSQVRRFEEGLSVVSDALSGYEAAMKAEGVLRTKVSAAAAVKTAMKSVRTSAAQGEEAADETAQAAAERLASLEAETKAARSILEGTLAKLAGESTEGPVHSRGLVTLDVVNAAADSFVGAIVAYSLRECGTVPPAVGMPIVDVVAADSDGIITDVAAVDVKPEAAEADEVVPPDAENAGNETVPKQVTEEAAQLEMVDVEEMAKETAQVEVMEVVVETAQATTIATVEVAEGAAAEAAAVAEEVEAHAAAEAEIRLDEATKDTPMSATTDAAIAVIDAMAAVGDAVEHVQRGSVRRLSMALEQHDAGAAQQHTVDAQNAAGNRRRSWQMVDGSWQRS